MTLDLIKRNIESYNALKFRMRIIFNLEFNFVSQATKQMQG